MDRSSLIAATFALGCLVGAGAIFTWYSTSATLLSGEAGAVQKLREHVASLPLQDQTRYESEQYGFAFSYPQDLLIEEFDEGGGRTTLVVHWPDSQVGFQLYVTPHTDETISGDIIRRDVGSAAIVDLREEDLRPDLRVATFLSESPLVGRTREIWFLHKGHLFEATAPVEAEALMRDALLSIELL